MSRLRENWAALRGRPGPALRRVGAAGGARPALLRPQFERRGVPAIGTLEVVQTEGTVSGSAQRQPRRESQAASPLSRRPRVLVGRLPMVSKQFGAVVGPVGGQALQPCRCPLVPVSLARRGRCW